MSDYEQPAPPALVDSTLKLAQRFQSLDTKRSAKLSRAREHASLTIPGLMPEHGFSETQALPVPYNSMPARGINRLGSRLVSALIPLNEIPFFALEVDDGIDPAGQDPSEEQKGMRRIERRVVKKLGTTNLRAALFQVMQHLQVVGDVLLHQNDRYNFQVYRLDHYVVCRRPDGEWYELILKEYVNPYSLPPELIAAGYTNAEKDKGGKKQDNCMYTLIERNPEKDSCKITREYQKKQFGESTYSICPYWPLQWIAINGENYGRSLIEENLGDVRCLDSISASLIDGIAANAEWRMGVNPAGITEISDLEDSVNGAYVPAREEDVFGIQMQNNAQVQACQASVTIKQQDLGQAFLMNSAVQPDGERVTAYQVRILANELEQALGGVFSSVARGLQVPIVRRTMLLMLQQKILIAADSVDADMESALRQALTSPDSILSIKVKSGLEALGREVERESIRQVMQEVVNLPDKAQAVLKWPGIMNRYFAAQNLEPTGLVMTEQEVQAENQRVQQQQMQAMAAQQAMQTAGKVTEQRAAAAAQPA